MKNYTILLLLAFSIKISSAQGVYAHLEIAQLSVNVAEGTTELMPFFTLFPDSLIPDTIKGLDSLGIIHFGSLNYNDITEISIESAELSPNRTPIFVQKTRFLKTDTLTQGTKKITNFVAGASYVFRLKVKTNTGQNRNLINRSMTVSLGNSKINCAKFNNVYRKACHNCFQNDIV